MQFKVNGGKNSTKDGFLKFIITCLFYNDLSKVGPPGFEPGTNRL